MANTNLGLKRETVMCAYEINDGVDQYWEVYIEGHQGEYASEFVADVELDDMGDWIAANLPSNFIHLKTYASYLLEFDAELAEEDRAAREVADRLNLTGSPAPFEFYG
jgi:hypothetical protein